MATVRAATIDLADVIDGSTEYVVTDLSGNDSYTYGGAETVDLVFNLSAAADYSGTISGNIRLVKRGTATLTLRSANSYTGGTKIEAGVVGISDSGALGDEAVDIVATKSASTPSCLRIDAAMTLANDINVSGGLATSTTPVETAATFQGYASIYVNVNANVEFSGDITATCDLYLWDVSSSGKTRTFSGCVSADGYSINAAPYSSTYVFSGGVRTSVFYAAYLYKHMGQVKFQTTAVEIGRVAIRYTKVWTQGVLNDDAHIYPYGSADKNRTHFTLYADETIGKWTTASSASTDAVYPVQCNPTTDDRRLTLKASENGTSYGTLMHKVSLVYDPQSSSCTQTVTCTAQRTHTTSGSITVNRGTFKVAGKVSMPNLQGIFVADGAAFIADTAGTTPFTSLANITVGAGATFFCAGNTTAPFSEGVTKLTIGEGASVTHPAGETFSVTELWKGGKRLSGGTYTPDGADGTKALPELKQGAVYVPTFAGDTQTLTWTGAAGSDVDTAANWQENEKPDWDSAGAELVFAADGSTSTYAEFGSAATAKKIVFRQPLGFTLGAGAGGSLRLLEGVEFGDTGDVAPTNTVDVPVEIVGDQTWSLPADPGSVFTLSKPLVSDENSAVDTLTMTSAVGTLNFFTTNSTYTGNLVAQAKTINIRGENALGLADKGGTVSLTLNHNSNTAKCWFRGCSIGQQLTCTMKISGNNYAIFDCAANTTNIFNGFVYAPNWTQFDAGSHTVFNGGARFYGYTRQRIYDGATIVFRDRLALNSDGGSHTFAPAVGSSSPNPRIVVECPVEMSKSVYFWLFTCPVPDGMKVSRSESSVWSGDKVEFFIRPDASRPEYFQYAVNAAGVKWAGRKYIDGRSDENLASGIEATVRDIAGGFEVKMSIPRSEVFAALPRAGDMFTVNFARVGPTAGGVSTWANVGQALCNPVKFGRVVWGGAKAHFGRRLDAARRKCGEFGTEAARAAALRAMAPLEEAVARHGGNNRAFGALETMFANFDQTMVAIGLSGLPLLVYRADDPWGNRLEPDGNTRPLEKIRIVAARNSRAWYPFVVKNTTAREFLGQAKVFDKGPGFNFAFENTSGAARHVSILEAVPSDVGGGALSYDPMSPLPMGTLLRIAPRGLAALWLELDTHGLAAGRSDAVLVVKRARAGFDTVTIPVEIDVRDLDLDAVEADRAAYDRFTSRCLDSPGMQKFAARHVGNIVYMTPWKGCLARQNRDGTWRPPDFAPLDRAIDARIAAGVPRERVKVWWFMALGVYWNAPVGANGLVAKIGTRTWDDGIRATVLALRDHLREAYGMGPGRFYLYLTDEPNANDGVDDPELKTKMSKTYYAAKVVKSADPALRTFTNPHAYGAYATEKFCATLRRLEECVDVIEFYRPNLNPGMIARTKDFRFEYWTYDILGSTVSPSVYRRDMWMNMRDGFRELTPYWHLVDMAGGDGFDPTDASSKDGRNKTDYGSIYADFDNASALTSRRQTANDLSYEDARLILMQRKRHAGDAARLAEVERLVKAAADKGSMEAMDAARARLLDM